jgi:iron complex outermembrane receptor protein
VKLGWSSFTDDGRWKSPVFGGYVGDRDITRISFTTLWEPTENMDWTLTWEKQRDDSMETPQRHLSTGLGFVGTQFNIGDIGCTTFGYCNWPDVSFGHIDNNYAQTDQNFEVQAVTLEGNWDIGENLTVTSVTGWRDLQERTRFDVDGTPAPIFETNRPNEFRQFSEELRVTGSFMDGRINYTGGLFYWNKDSKALAFLDLLGFCLLPGPACLTGGILTGALPVPIPIDPATGEFAYTHAFQQASEDGTAYAAFANVSFDIIPERLILTVGGRYTRDHKEYAATEGSFIPAGAPGTPQQGGRGIPQIFPGRNPVFNPGFNLGGLGISQPPCPQDTDLCIVGGEGTWREFTPKYGLDWKVTDDFLAYVSYAVGFRAGGFNERNASPGTIGPFDPEKLKTWEFGLKTSWFDNRLIVNAAYFTEDFKDKLEGVVTLGGPLGTFTDTTNAAEAELQGVEVEITAAPTPYLTMGLNYSWLDGEYEEFDVVVQDQMGGTMIQDNSGAQLANVIPYSISAWGKIETEIGPGVASLFAQYRYRDAAEAATNIDPRSDSPAVYDIDVTAAYEFEYNGKPFRASLFVRNLTDHEDVGGFLVASPIFVFAPAQFSPPRTWGFELQFAF